MTAESIRHSDIQHPTNNIPPSQPEENSGPSGESEDTALPDLVQDHIKNLNNTSPTAPEVQLHEQDQVWDSSYHDLADMAALNARSLVSLIFMLILFTILFLS